MIEFQNVTKTYESGLTVLNDISLTVPRGELVMLIGPSGCGKSTLLRLVNRMLDLTGGEIRVGGQSVAALDPVRLRQRIGYVIQSIGLFPHLSIEENVELVPSITGIPAAQRRQRAHELLHLMELDPAQFARRYPRQLSGGQQQRVGIARALAADPEYLLMDEPFSAVDPITREKLQDQFLTLKREIGKTILFVTHDIDEAVRLGDRICLLEGGRVQQYDTPDTLLHRPANAFVASFVGENRELKRLSLRPVSALMRRGTGTGGASTGGTGTGDTGGSVPHDLSAERALARLLSAGGRPLNVTGPGGEVVGSLRLEDYGQSEAASSTHMSGPASASAGPGKA